MIPHAETLDRIALQREQEHRNREADEAWRHYQETGLHATGEEVLKWVASWGARNPLAPPKCHGGSGRVLR